MPAQSESFDVAVVGGGAIGLACAWRAQQRGADVVVIDAGEPGAWHVAAGMLAPVSEAEFGERELLSLGLESAKRYAAFCAELEDPGYRATGTMVVARDRDEAEALDRLAAFRSELGLPVERLRPTQARKLEPALAPTIRLALDIEGDHAIDPRMLVAALGKAFTGARRDARAHRSAADRRPRDRRGDRARVPSTAGQVVLAAGVHNARIELPEPRPRSRPPGQGPGPAPARPAAAPASVDRTIRGDGVYFVPRGDGRYVLGATMEERGWDTSPTAGGVYELLRDLSEIVPGIFELEIEELIAGLRPATPDNLPAIGRGALDGLVWATGHYRNGILLTPVTAELVAAVLAGEPVPEFAAAADPRRFEGVLA